MQPAIRFAFVFTLAAALSPAIAAAQQPAPVLREPPASPPARRHSLTRSAVIDCVAHGTWTPPPGWSALQLGHGQILARSPTRGAALLRGSHRGPADEAAARAVLDALLGVPVTQPALVLVDPQHPRRGAAGSVQVPFGGTSAEVRWYRGTDRYGGRADLWVAVVLPSESSAWAQIDVARSSWLQLVSHACECGDDCDRRPTSPPQPSPSP